MTFPRYPNYKASGFTWLGDVPEHWQLKRLGHYFDERRERASDTEFEPLSVTKLGIVPRLESAAKTQDGDNRKKVLAGDFVINSRSDRKGSSGLSPLDGSVSLICTVLIPTGLHGPFIHHLFRSELFQEEYYRWGKGIVADLWSTNFSDMKNIVLGVPSEAEQTQIARFLDHETARIDALIEEQQRLIELLKEKRQAVISHAVTKGLDPTVPMKDSGVEWLGEVPAHWDVKALRYLGECQNGINIGGDAFGSGSPFVSYGDVYKNEVLPVEVAGLVQSSPEDRQRYSVKAGDVFFTRTSETVEEIGFSATCLQDLPDAVFAGFLIRFRPAGKSIDPKFSKYYFRNQGLRIFFNKEMNLVTRASLSQDLLKLLPVTLPPVTEQIKIADFLDRVIAEFASLLEQGLRSIDLLTERRSALISAAVTGKIDVRGWQPPVSTQAPKFEVAEAV
ncbi:MAG: hypothetical protein JL55_14615 [Pseudomonas sp. BICA1-14]|nr:restriction endonuclease subunit S [[Pseudomonas] sp. BICA1-14]KJS78428.1 MAG: hypothetical protein JL55_14615 [[Pseudomonas] sp. BICA1-14]